MGRFLPKEARPVEAFQWKQNSPQLIEEMIKFLRQEGISFELHPDGDNVAILIGDEDDQFDDLKYVRINNCEWFVYDGGDFYRIVNSVQFFDKYRSIP